MKLGQIYMKCLLKRLNSKKNYKKFKILGTIILNVLCTSSLPPKKMIESPDSMFNLISPFLTIKVCRVTYGSKIIVIM